MKRNLPSGKKYSETRKSHPHSWFAENRIPQDIEQIAMIRMRPKMHCASCILFRRKRIPIPQSLEINTTHPMLERHFHKLGHLPEIVRLNDEVHVKRNSQRGNEFQIAKQSHPGASPIQVIRALTSSIDRDGNSLHTVGDNPQLPPPFTGEKQAIGVQKNITNWRQARKIAQEGPIPRRSKRIAPPRHIEDIDHLQDAGRKQDRMYLICPPSRRPPERTGHTPAAWALQVAYRIIGENEFMDSIKRLRPNGSIANRIPAHSSKKTFPPQKGTMRTVTKTLIED